MSWYCSRALAEAFSAERSSAGAAFAPSRSTPTPAKSSRPGKTTAACRRFRYGTTCAPLTADHGEELLTWYLAAFPAKAPASPAAAPGWKIRAQASGGSIGESLAKYDPATCGWKTRQCSLLGEECESLATLPRWGMTAGGELWALTTPAHLTDATASGWLLPTPAARDWRSPNRRTYAERGGGKKGEQLPNWLGSAVPPTLAEWIMGWPLGWTDCTRSGMEKFRQWWRSHGAHSQEGTADA